MGSMAGPIPRLLDQSAPDAKAREKGSKAHDTFEVWHHHASVRRSSEWALMLRFDQRR